LTYGDQEWTVINGAMETYRDGTEIPQVSDATQWENLTTGAWCYYGNDPSKGKLYNWYALVGIHDAASLSDASLRKEFAPEGWHVPADTEWTTLQNYLIANGYNYDGSTTENKIGKAMASASGWTSINNEGAIGNSNPNNSSGFNALPGGSILGTFFSGYGSEARFWTLTYFGNNRLYHKRMDYRNLGIGTHNEGATLGCSVRFVRN
ncbi:fibrobacter succinogenes major paralogous domain-containing protein, partial [Polaribacter sp.]|nr:fibrobacter succinogenes major paralogous domain-containing protein [Polaribacter sp.]